MDFSGASDDPWKAYRFPKKKSFTKGGQDITLHLAPCQGHDHYSISTSQATAAHRFCLVQIVVHKTLDAFNRDQANRIHYHCDAAVGEIALKYIPARSEQNTTSFKRLHHGHDLNLPLVGS